MEPENDPLLITIKEAARLTSLSQSTIVRLMDKGEIPFVYAGHRRLIEYGALLTWIDGLRPRG